MICMVYISSARHAVSEREIAGIVKASQLNNLRLGITGILLYNAGSFMQLIEGENDAVEMLYDKISKDHRHGAISLLLKENITHRNFEGWQMGYRNLEALKKVSPEVLSPFMDDESNFSIYQNNPYRALHFLEMFKKIKE